MSSAQWYIEIIDCRGRGSKTGMGAAWPTEAEARRAFDGARFLEVSSKGAEFLIDLHNANGDLLDTICTNAIGFEVLIGDPPKSVEEYDAHDADYWQRARAERAAAP